MSSGHQGLCCWDELSSMCSGQTDKDITRCIWPRKDKTELFEQCHILKMGQNFWIEKKVNLLIVLKVNI